MTSPTSKRQRTIAAMTLLHARFPALFPTAAADVRPLALGIHQTLVDRLASDAGADPKAIGWALRKWCKREGYTRALARGGNRIDLDGRPVEPVAEEHRRAKAQLKTGKRPAAPAPKARPAPTPPPPRQPDHRPKVAPAPPNPAVRVVEVIVKKRRKIVRPE